MDRRQLDGGGANNEIDRQRGCVLRGVRAAMHGGRPGQMREAMTSSSVPPHRRRVSRRGQAERPGRHAKQPPPARNRWCGRHPALAERRSGFGIHWRRSALRGWRASQRRRRWSPTAGYRSDRSCSPVPLCRRATRVRNDLRSASWSCAERRNHPLCVSRRSGGDSMLWYM
jgi:hypothetical protein